MRRLIIILLAINMMLYANTKVETVELTTCMDTQKYPSATFKELKNILVEKAQQEAFDKLYQKYTNTPNTTKIVEEQKKELFVNVIDIYDRNKELCQKVSVEIKEEKLQNYLPQKVSLDRICHKDENLSPDKLQEKTEEKSFKELIAQVSKKEVSTEEAKKLVRHYVKKDGQMYLAKGAYCLSASGEIVPFEVEKSKQLNKIKSSTENTEQNIAANDIKLDNTIYGKWFGAYYWKDANSFMILNIEIKKDNTFKAIWNRGKLVENAYYTGKVMFNENKVVLFPDQKKLTKAEGGDLANYTTDPLDLVLDDNKLKMSGKIMNYPYDSAAKFFKVKKFPLEYLVKNNSNELSGKWYGYTNCDKNLYYIYADFDKNNLIWYHSIENIVIYDIIPLKSDNRIVIQPKQNTVQVFKHGKKLDNKAWSADGFSGIIDNNSIEGDMTVTCKGKIHLNKVSQFPPRLDE